METVLNLILAKRELSYYTITVSANIKININKHLKYYSNKHKLK